MDNSNNNNPSNNPPPQPLPNSGENPQTPNQSPFPAPPSTPSPWDPNPAQPQPIPPVNTPAMSSFEQPVTTPQDLTPTETPTYSPAPPSLDTSPVDTYPAQPTQPATITPPEAVGTQPVTSPLDNPWGAPTQPPPIDGSTPITPDAVNTYSASPQPQPETTPPWSNQGSPSIQSADQGLENPKPPNPFAGEPAPTDLSHLINNNAPTESTQPTGSEAETLVAPASGAPEVPTVPTEGSKGFPKWLIGVGVGLLIVVAGVSAYFILGIGQTGNKTSVPAETVPSQTQEVKPPAPIPTPITQPPAATGSANFGQLQGSGTQQATSAADLIRQRQQQGR